MRRIALFVIALLLPFAAFAQVPPYGSFSTEKTGTIATTGTYQSVLAASQNGGRKSCTIQNTGTHNMLVFFGGTKPSNSAGVGFLLTPPSGTAQAGGAISCGLVGGGVAVDQVWIEGTMGETFEYTSQP